MATGSTNAAGKAEPLRTLTTDQIKMSEWMKEYFYGEEGPPDGQNVLDAPIWMIAEKTLQLESVTDLSIQLFEAYGVPDGPYSNETLFLELVRRIVPNAVAINKDVLLMYNLAEADINRMFAVILQETIPNAIQEAIGDAMGGEY